ncbi:MAG: hypothetical protein C0515_12360 [Novosphingobium sp.]|nr:hypothetical protein [Novosphingobium sp.]
MKQAVVLASALSLALGSGAALAQDNVAYVGTGLFGENETGKGAGEEASGDFSAELDMGKGRLCYMLEVDGLDEVTGAHIHEGGKGNDGPPVLTLQLAGPSGDDICVAVDRELLTNMARNKARYYVNVHTVAFPDGAIRGQLSD